MILSADVHDDKRETEEDRSHSGRDRVDSLIVESVYMCLQTFTLSRPDSPHQRDPQVCEGAIRMMI